MRELLERVKLRIRECSIIEHKVKQVEDIRLRNTEVKFSN